MTATHLTTGLTQVRLRHSIALTRFGFGLFLEGAGCHVTILINIKHSPSTIDKLGDIALSILHCVFLSASAQM